MRIPDRFLRTWQSRLALCSLFVSGSLPHIALGSGPETLDLNSLGTASPEEEGLQRYLGKWGENARFSVDISSRVIRNESADVTAYANFFGLDYYKVFSGNRGDWATVILQPYLTRIDNLGGHPPFFESANDWELVYRIFNVNFTGLGEKMPNIRLGHMEAPFGLEHVVNTNGTLRDFIHGPNVGVKADWGASLNGSNDAFEYELALLRGSGNELSDTGDPGLIVGRIGTPREADLAFGLSFYNGKTQHPSQADNTVTRDRIGVDMIWQAWPLTVLAEVSAGENEGTNVLNSVFEIDWENGDGTWMAFYQLQSFRTDFPGGWDAAHTGHIGVRYTPDAHWAISAMWKHGLDAYAGATKPNVMFFQLRYRF